MHSGTPNDFDLRQALESLFQCHGEKWLGFVRRMLRNRADAEDAVQEAIRRVLASRQHFASPDDLRMYLARAVANTAIEFYHLRRRDSLRCLPLKEQYLAHAGAISPQQQMERLEEFAERSLVLMLALEGLDTLPPKQYQALQMTLLDPSAASIREAGVENGIPYSTLRHRSLQGIRRLRSYVHRAARITQTRPVPA
jgi:RNA polymerase sigma factor (sigma-70 family)